MKTQRVRFVARVPDTNHAAVVLVVARIVTLLQPASRTIRRGKQRLFAMNPAGFWAKIVLLVCLTASEVTHAAPAMNTDLAIGKNANTTSSLVGNTVQFNIGMTNLGDVFASDITGNDVVPAGFAILGWNSSGSPSAPVYNPTNGNWTLAALSPGGTASLTISTIATNAGIYTNTALLTGASPPDTNSSGNAASVVVTLATQPADLMVAQTAGLTNGTLTSQFNVGDAVVFSITIGNLGPGIPFNITGNDIVPAGFTVTGWTSSGPQVAPVYDPATGVWTLDYLYPSNAAFLSIYATAAGSGTFTNTTAIAGASVSDPNPNNNSSSVVVTVAPQTIQADLQITKTTSTNSVKVGQQVVFTLALQNLGPNNVNTNIIVTDCLPAGFQYVTDSTVGGGSIGTYSPGTCLWTLPGLGAGTTVYLYITALANNIGTFTNTATVAVPQGCTDPNLLNNTSSAVVAITPLQADLAVTKTVFTNTLPVFSTFGFSFTLTVTNNGPDTVSNLTLTDLLPAGLPFSGAISNAGSSYTASNGLWTLNYPLAPGQGASMILVAGVGNPGNYTNTLTVNVPSTVIDTNPNNNTASVVVTVLPVYRILGYVGNCSSNGVPLANVKITLSGATNLTTTTSASGNYSFDSVFNGVYTLTPSQPGNLFTPASTVVIVSNAWVTAPQFIGGIGLIYGQLLYSGNPITNQPVTLSGGGLARPRMVLTDVNGYYIFTNTPAGNYIVAAAATNGYLFTPTNAAVTLDAMNCAAVTNFAAAPRAVQLVALEVVQVIQDWSNSVPLIQGKETYVRAHFQLTNNNPVLLQGARLVNGGSAVSPLPPGTLLVTWTNAAARPIREQLTNSLLFRLPADWLAGTVNLQFVCTNNITVIPTNVVPANSTVQVSFVPAAPLPVKIYPVNWTNAGGAYQQIGANNLADVPRRLLSMYPVPSVDAEPAPPLIMTNRAPPPYTQINAQLSAFRLLDWLSGFTFRNGFPPPNQRIYHGAVAGATVAAWGRNDSGLAVGIPSFVSSGLMPPNNDFYVQLFLRHLATHEIGHNLGRPHAVSAALFGTFVFSGTTYANGTPACSAISGPTNASYPLFQRVPPPGGPYKPALGPMSSGDNSLIYGLDTLTYRTAQQYNPIASPYVYSDVMSYCGTLPLSWWISTYNYTNIYNYVANNFSGPPGGRPGGGPSTNWMIFRGVMDFTQNSGELLPTLSVSTTILPPSPPPGNYSLVLFDSNGNILQEIPFQPSTDEDEDGDDDTGSFMIPVQANPAIREVALWNGTNVLAALVGNTNLPYVTSLTLSSTNGGFYTGSGQLNINWTGGDAEPNTPLTYDVEYSADGGATWETLAVDWPGQSYSLDSQVMPASTQGMIRVIASDGLDSSSSQSTGTFTVLPHPPTILLNAPMDGAIFVADEQIFLDASIYDSQDGPLDGVSVQWTSSLDGVLGYGAVLNIEADALSEGSHTITVTATDSLGLTNSASAQIVVLRQPPPQLSIQLVANQAQISWLASATNYVLESSTSLSPANWSAVTNAPFAADSQQTVTVDISPTSQFFRLRMLP
jgi:uncharacterized repeat protein (TIGR01451 family)